MNLSVIFLGLDKLLVGIILPMLLSLAASIVRVALFGWKGVKEFSANFCISCFLGVCTNWVLLRYTLDTEIKAVVICAVSLLASDILRAITSKRAINAYLAIAKNRLRVILLHWLGIEGTGEKIIRDNEDKN